MSAAINQHKRMAMGQGVPQNLARGGSVASPVGSSGMVPRPSGASQSPLVTARHNNGVPGMCGGGAMKGKKR